MPLTVKQSLTIGDDQVEQVAEFAGLTVYSSIKSSAHGDLRLYFTQGGEVVQRLDVEADMSQGSGFVSDYTFIEPTE